MRVHACDKWGQVVNEVEVGGIHTCGGTRIACLYFICIILYMLLISFQQQKGYILCHDDLYVAVLQGALDPEVYSLGSVCYMLLSIIC